MRDQHFIKLIQFENNASNLYINGEAKYSIWCDYGTELTLKVVPRTYCYFSAWKNGDKVISNNAEFKYRVLGNDTLTAVCLKTIFTLTLQPNIAEGGTVSGGGSRDAYTLKDISATPNAGYHFVNWTKDGTVISTEKTVSYQAKGNETLVANFHKLTAHDAKAATCTEKGIGMNYWECSTCKKYYSDNKGETAIEANSWVTEATGHSIKKVAYKAPTCTVDGNKEHWRCSTCGTLFSNAEGTQKTTLAAVTIAAKHNWSDETKTHCNACGNYWLRYTATERVVPSFANGKLDGYSDERNTYDSETREGAMEFTAPLETIGWAVFANKTALQSVTLPNTVKTIANSAFNRCSLTKLILPRSVEDIGGYAFANNDGLKSVEFNSVPKVNTIQSPSFANNPSNCNYTLKLTDDSHVEGATLSILTSYPTYSRTLTCEWETVVLPFQIDASVANENYDLYTVSGTANGEESTTKLLKLKKATSTISSNTPLLIHKKCEGDYNLTLTGSLKSVNATSMLNSTLAGETTFTAVYNAKTIYSRKGYLLHDGESHFQLIDGSVTTQPFRAYINVYMNGVDRFVIHLHENITTIGYKARTCTHAGNETYYKCDDCGTLFSDKNCTQETTLAAVTLPIDANAHVYDDETRTYCTECEHCWIRYTATEKVVPHDTTALYGYSDERNTYNSETGEGVMEFTSPLEIIGKYAFLYCYSLRSITLPSSVNTISDYAFGMCINLDYFMLNTSSLALDRYSFYDCYFQKDRYNCFKKDDVNLVDIEQEDGLLLMNDGTIKVCRGWATNVTIPSNATLGNNKAFGYCGSLKTLNFTGRKPFEFTYEEGDEECREMYTVFKWCPLSAIYVPEPFLTEYRYGWSDYEVNGEYINDNIIQPYPKNRIITYKANVDLAGYFDNDLSNFAPAVALCHIYDAQTSMGYAAFDRDVTEVGPDAFKDELNLTYINLPSTVEYVSRDAFPCLSALTVAFHSIPDLYYERVASEIPLGYQSTVSLTDDSHVTLSNTYMDNLTHETITYTRTGIKNQWGTIVLPFDVTIDSKSQPYDFYTLQEVTSSKLVLQLVEGTLPAGNPALVRMSEAARNAETGKYDLTVKQTNGKIMRETTGQGGTLTLDGTYQVDDISNRNGYIISNNRFWNIQKVKGSNKVYNAPFRAYLAGSLPNNAPQLELSWDEDDDEETTLEDLFSTTDDTEEAIFDLNGRRLDRMQKGINIVKRGNKTFRILVK